jgi:hypothetical protein
MTTATIIGHQIGAMVLGVPALTEALAARPLEVQAGGVHEDHRQLAEQVATGFEQPLLHRILEAARGERRAVCLLGVRQLLAEPAHRAVEMMEGEVAGALDPTWRFSLEARCTASRRFFWILPLPASSSSLSRIPAAVSVVANSTPPENRCALPRLADRRVVAHVPVSGGPALAGTHTMDEATRARAPNRRI